VNPVQEKEIDQNPQGGLSTIKSPRAVSQLSDLLLESLILIMSVVFVVDGFGEKERADLPKGLEEEGR
jgi:hypothetical protein